MSAAAELDSELGFNLIGSLLVFQDNSSWFCGYKMQQKNMKNKHRNNSASWFVASGVLSAIDFIKKHPDLGINFPESLDFKQNQELVDYFVRLNGQQDYLSFAIEDLYMSEEYPTYKIANTYNNIGASE